MKIKKSNLFYFKIIVLLLSPILAYSQSGWYQIPSGVTSSSSGIESVFFPTENTGYISGYIGYSGFIRKTTNSGNSWDSLRGYNATYLRSIYFITNETGIVVGRDASGLDGIGIYIKTTNGGLSWTTTFSPSATDLFGIQFSSTNTGYAVGSYFRHTPQDEGGTIDMTTNGGLDWFRSTTYYHSAIRFYGLHFLNDQTGFVVGAGINGSAVAHTTNSGQVWNYQNILNPVSGDAWTTYFLNEDTGFIGGNTYTGSFYPSSIKKTTDKGIHWNDVQMMDSSTVVKIKFINNTTGFAVGLKGNGGFILKTTNQGNNWYLQKITNTTLNDVYFINELTGYIAGQNGILWKTTDAGGPIGITTISNQVPKSFSLSQNYPNPFNPVTNIKFDINKSGIVKISIFDILGHEVAILVNQILQTGSYTVDWKADNFSSGVYFYEIKTDDFKQSKKMVLIK